MASVFEGVATPEPLVNRRNETKLPTVLYDTVQQWRLNYFVPLASPFAGSIAAMANEYVVNSEGQPDRPKYDLFRITDVIARHGGVKVPSDRFGYAMRMRDGSNLVATMKWVEGKPLPVFSDWRMVPAAELNTWSMAKQSHAVKPSKTRIDQPAKDRVKTKRAGKAVQGDRV